MLYAQTIKSGIEKARRNTDSKVKVPKNRYSTIPNRFSESILSAPLGQNNAYRENKAENSIQIREYDDYYTLELDQYNPETDNLRKLLSNIIMHAAVDAKEYIMKTLSTVSSIALLVILFLEESKNTSLNPSHT